MISNNKCSYINSTAFNGTCHSFGIVYQKFIAPVQHGVNVLIDVNYYGMQSMVCSVIAMVGIQLATLEYDM